MFDRLEHPKEEDVPKPSADRMDNQLSRAVDLLKGIRVYQSLHKTPAVAEAN